VSAISCVSVCYGDKLFRSHENRLRATYVGKFIHEKQVDCVGNPIADAGVGVDSGNETLDSSDDECSSPGRKRQKTIVPKTLIKNKIHNAMKLHREATVVRNTIRSLIRQGFKILME
jgi:hypothetical protein